MGNAESAKGFAGLASLRSSVETDIAAARAAAQKRAAPVPSAAAPAHLSAAPAPPPRPVVPHPPHSSVPQGSGWGSGFGAVALVVIGVAIVAWAMSSQLDKTSRSGSTTAASATSRTNAVPFEETQPPIGTNHVLYGSQINYCLAEELRLEGMRQAAQADIAVEAFNAGVDDYNARCGSYRYSGNAVESARSTVTPHAAALREAGYRRAVPATPTRDERLAALDAKYGLEGASAYIVVDSANVRSRASGTAPVIAKLAALTEVSAQAASGEWIPIRFEQSGREVSGFVARRLIDLGSAADVRVRYCAPDRPSTGTVLQQSQRGPHTIKVTAGTDDVVTKLKSPAGKTVLAFYTRRGESTSLDSVPEGSYRVLFASGSSYSRKCGEFLDSMSVQQDPQLATFQSTSDETNVYTSIAEYRLVEQADGNFRPTSADVAAFRD